jgi:hypothetical protein
MLFKIIHLVFHVAASVAVVLVVTGCGERGSPPIQLILQPGFRGVIRVTFQVAGAPELRKCPDVDLLEVPSTGDVVLSSANPLSSWRQLFAKYPDGTCLRGLRSMTASDGGSNGAEDSLFVDVLFSDDSGNVWIFVGTKGEHAQLSGDERRALELFELQCAKFGGV